MYNANLSLVNKFNFRKNFLNNLITIMLID